MDSTVIRCDSEHELSQTVMNLTKDGYRIVSVLQQDSGWIGKQYLVIAQKGV